MIALDEQLKKLKEREQHIEREKRKVEFLKHILESARTYEDADFKEVRDDVVSLLSAFVESASNDIVNAIVSGPVQPKVEPKTNTTTAPAAFAQETPKAPVKTPKPSVAEVMNFALANRHLGGKTVEVMNESGEVFRGDVVGLDCPHVLVKAKDGSGVIKALLDNVKLTV